MDFCRLFCYGFPDLYMDSWMNFPHEDRAGRKPEALQPACFLQAVGHFNLYIYLPPWEVWTDERMSRKSCFSAEFLSSDCEKLQNPLTSDRSECILSGNELLASEHYAGGGEFLQWGDIRRVLSWR